MPQRVVISEYDEQGNPSYGLQGKGSNEILSDTSVSWVNSAAAGTNTDIDIPLPTYIQKDALYVITVTNPSVDSDLTVIVKNKETFNGTASYPEVTRFGVAKTSSDGKALLVQGFLLGEAGRISISNDAAIGVSGAFTGYVRVRKV